MAQLILTGDVNLMNVTDPATPFARVAGEFRAADLVFSNLECCLYAPPVEQSFHNEGFFADPTVGSAALKAAARRSSVICETSPTPRSTRARIS